jgi:uncharacterized protein involved in outer membrane biogenesis
MRKHFIAAGLILACLLIIAAWNVNSIVEGNKEYLLGRLARTFGHAITADKVEIGYQPFAVRLANLAIAGDPADTANPLVLAKDMQVKLRFLPLFLGRFQPAQITLDSPVITIVRDPDGRYNYEPQGRERKPPANRNNRSDEPPRDRQLFAIAAVQITNGTLRYRDLKNDSELALTQIDLRQSEFDEDEPVELQLSAAVMTAQPNLKFNIRVGPIAGIRDYRNYPIEGNLNAEQLDLGKVNRALPQFKRATPKLLRFDGIYDIKDFKFKGTLNNPSIKGAVSGTDASFRFD